MGVRERGQSEQGSAGCAASMGSAGARELRGSEGSGDIYIFTIITDVAYSNLTFSLALTKIPGACKFEFHFCHFSRCGTPQHVDTLAHSQQGYVKRLCCPCPFAQYAASFSLPHSVPFFPPPPPPTPLFSPPAAAATTSRLSVRFLSVYPCLYRSPSPSS